MDKFEFNQDAEMRKEIFDEIGTRPSFLWDVVESGRTVSDFIINAKKIARRASKGCLESGERYIRPLLLAMLNSRTGILTSIEAMEIAKTTTEKIADGPLVKQYHVLLYDIENGLFKFHSRTMSLVVREMIGNT